MDCGHSSGAARARRVRSRAGEEGDAGEAVTQPPALREASNATKTLTENDLLSALCERALSNSVPANVRALCGAEEEEDAISEWCSETTSSRATSSSLRARRSLPGLRLPNEAFDGDRADDVEGEIEPEGVEVPTDGWIQPCFACGKLTWQNVSLGGYRVYRCSQCAAKFRERANALKDSSTRATIEGNGMVDGDEEAKRRILDSLVAKLHAVVRQNQGEGVRGSFTAIE